MTSEPMPDIRWQDPEFEQKVWQLIDENRSFKVVAYNNDRHFASLARMLDSFSGLRTKAAFVRNFFDAWATSLFFACWGKAVEERNYSWKVETKEEFISVIFTPADSRADQTAASSS